MYLKAVYTAEASAIISICMIVIGMCFILAFNIYHETQDYIHTVNLSEMEIIERFRNINSIKETVGGIID